MADSSDRPIHSLLSSLPYKIPSTPSKIQVGAAADTYDTPHQMNVQSFPYLHKEDLRSDLSAGGYFQTLSPVRQSLLVS